MRVNAGVLVDSLGWALLHSLWQIALVAAVIFVALRLIPRHNAQLRFLTAYGGLAATFLLFLVTWGICYRTIGSVDPMPVMAATATPPEGWQAMIAMLGKTTWLISLLWGVGFSVLGVRYAQALRATARLKHEGTGPVPADWEMRFRLWIERLGADPRAMILQSSRITTPLTIGTLKPIVLVPTGFFLRLPIDQAEAILVHEIAHICRQDYLLGLIQALICNIFFYHPAIAYLSRQIDIEREYACDARVVEETGNTNALAQGLGKVALESRDLLPGFAMAADGRRSPLMDRITRLRERPFRRENATTMPVAALTLVLAGCLTIAASADASFSSGTSKDAEETDADITEAREQEQDSIRVAEVAEADMVPALWANTSREERSTVRSAPEQHGSRSESHMAATDVDGWRFTPQPGWTFSFRGSRGDTRKSSHAEYEPVTFEPDNSSLLRNAALQTAAFDPRGTFVPRIQANSSDECDDKAELIAHRQEREAERLEAQIERQREREEVRIEAEIARQEAEIERQMDREEARIEREIERVERQMERAAELSRVEMDRELARLSVEMATLSTEMAVRMERHHVEQARALAERARSRFERSSRYHRGRPSPSAVPAPPEPPQPVITISFNVENVRAAAMAAAADALTQIGATTAS